MRKETGDVVTFDGISVDFTKMEVSRDGESVVLTAQEFKTLKFLIQNAERVITRDELLNESLFLDLDQARQIITAWVADYNTRRPHSSLGYRTQAAYADHLTATGHRAALADGSARCPVAHTAPKSVSTAEALIAAG